MSQLLLSLLHAILALCLFGLVCICLQKFFPSIRGQKLWRKETKLDLIYWLSSYVITLKAITFFAALLLTLISVVNPQTMAYITATAHEKASVIDVILGLILLDLSGYWTHRIAHSRKFWKFHAIHHSSPEIDWLSSNRFHPLESIVIVAIGFNICMLAGIGLKAVALAFAIRGFYGYIVHANVSWNYGPLGYVFASPYFHRWHHTTDKEGLDKNFAGVFSLWDFMFGTAYLPKKTQPKNFGGAKEIGTSFWQQLTYPFR